MLTPQFAADPLKVTQWRAFLRKSRLTLAFDDFAAIVDALNAFLVPVATAIADSTSFDRRWTPPGPWKPMSA